MTRRKSKAALLSSNDLNLVVEYVPTEQLRANPNNARTHSRQQLRMLGRSIDKYRMVRPILADATNQIVAGHGIWGACKLRGLTRVPVIRLKHLSPEQVRAYSLADNRLAEKSQWDRKQLAQELTFLAEVGFPIEDTGFEVAEIDIIVSEAAEAESDESVDDAIPELRPAEAVSRQGDCWTLGKHRLLCADALSAASYNALLGQQCAEFVFTDPPYNVPIDGHVSGLGRVRHREFAVACGEMSPQQFTTFLATAFQLTASCSIPGAIHQYCIDWRHIHEMLTAGQQVFGEQLLNVCVWRKSNAGMGSFYRSQHELVCVFRNGDHPHINNIELGRHGRSRSNVWDYAGVNTFKKGRMDELKMHPTVKPVALVADAIKDCSSRGSLVLDPFAGSGTILIAAEKTGRAARAMELDPMYVDVAVQRWQSYTGQFALHESGKSFDELKEERGSSSALAIGSVR